MTAHEFALSDVAARLTGTDASLSTSLRGVERPLPVDVAQLRVEIDRVAGGVGRDLCRWCGAAGA
jgi:hypothetical protein